MAAPRMTQEEIGALYIREDGTAWKLVGYASEPTVTLERLERVEVAQAEGFLPCRTSGVVGTPIFDGFTRLVLDGGASEQVARCAYPGCRDEDVNLVGYVRVGRAEDLGVENVFACPSHDRWLRDDAGENLLGVGASA